MDYPYLVRMPPSMVGDSIAIREVYGKEALIKRVFYPSSKIRFNKRLTIYLSLICPASRNHGNHGYFPRFWAVLGHSGNQFNSDTKISCTSGFR